MAKPRQPISCSFCGAPETPEVVGVPGGPAVCLRCIAVCLEIIARRQTEALR